MSIVFLLEMSPGIISRKNKCESMLLKRRSVLLRGFYSREIVWKTPAATSHFSYTASSSSSSTRQSHASITVTKPCQSDGGLLLLLRETSNSFSELFVWYHPTSQYEMLGILCTYRVGTRERNYIYLSISCLIRKCNLIEIEFKGTFTKDTYNGCIWYNTIRNHMQLRVAGVNYRVNSFF